MSSSGVVGGGSGGVAHGGAGGGGGGSSSVSVADTVTGKNSAALFATPTAVAGDDYVYDPTVPIQFIDRTPMKPEDAKVVSVAFESRGETLPRGPFALRCVGSGRYLYKLRAPEPSMALLSAKSDLNMIRGAHWYFEFGSFGWGQWAIVSKDYGLALDGKGATQTPARIFPDGKGGYINAGGGEAGAAIVKSENLRASATLGWRIVPLPGNQVSLRCNVSGLYLSGGEESASKDDTPARLVKPKAGCKAIAWVMELVEDLK